MQRLVGSGLGHVHKSHLSRATLVHRGWTLSRAASIMKTRAPRMIKQHAFSYFSIIPLVYLLFSTEWRLTTLCDAFSCYLQMVAALHGGSRISDDQASSVTMKFHEISS